MSAAQVIQSPEATFCQLTAVPMLIPTVRARIAAGSSAASVNSAAARSARGCSPMALSRSLMVPASNGMARTAAGEQPGHDVGLSDGGLAAAGGEVLAHESGQGVGEHDRHGGEREPDGCPVVVDNGGGQALDAGRVLGVEEYQQPGDAVGQRQAVVVEKPAGVLPPLLGVVRPLLAGSVGS